MEAQTFAPGHYPDVSNDVYQASHGTSKSHLDDIAPPNSPRHYWAKRIDPDRKPRVITPALLVGDACHKAVLEPDLLDSTFAVAPECDRRTTEGKRIFAEFAAEAVGKTILTAEQYATVKAVRDSVHSHPVARGLFQGGVPEQSYYAEDPETGSLIKCRLDYDRLTAEGMIVDLKTTEDASEDGFGWSATKYRYDVQGVWYPDVLEALWGQPVVETFVYVAVEKAWPHAIGIYYLDLEDAKRARPYARRDLNRILECRAADDWPDFGREPKPLRISKYRRQAIAD